MKLYAHEELNQTKLMSHCGLNNVKQKAILDDMVEKEIISRTEESWENKTIIKYKVLREILEPYEALFPRYEKNKS